MDKVVMITGGARGIGKACVEAFVSAHYRVVFTYYKSRKQAKDLVESLGKESCFSAYLNVKNITSCRKLAERIIERYGNIDVLINNAGITLSRSLLFMKKEEWEDIIQTNLSGVFNVTKAVLPYMFRKRQGRIINISSVSAIKALAGQCSYAATKAGICAFSRSLAKELASYNICVNTILPGFIDTDMTKTIKEKENILSSIPLGRFGCPEEVARLCLFLAADSSSYITGAEFVIDGGLSL